MVQGCKKKDKANLIKHIEQFISIVSYVCASFC